VVEALVELAGEAEFLFHPPDKPQGAEVFGTGQLAQVQAEVIMGRAGVGVLIDGMLAGGDSLLGELGSLGMVGGELGQVKTGAGELPGGVGGSRRVLVLDLGVLEGVPGVGNRLNGRRVSLSGETEGEEQNQEQ